MLLAQPNLKHISTITHEGKVLLIATVVDSGSVSLVYTVKQDGFEDSALQNPQGSGWESFRRVQLPQDVIGDASVEAQEQNELTDKQGKHLLRSIYNSADLTADAPVQLVAHDEHLYLFRQSTRGTLLVDRFVLDGMTNTLTAKLEVRFKRSRQRYAPLKATKINSAGQMESLDSLDFRDMQNQLFTEPTREICPELINNLQNGWFGVVVTPTNEQDSYRWHLFAYNRATKKIDLVTLRADSDQIFDVQDYWFRTIDPITDQAQYNTIPGLIHRELELQVVAGSPLTITNGLAAIKYDVQREQQTQNGPQLVRDTSKVLLAIPTDSGTATLSFAISADGRLAQITDESKDELLRSQEREILLPVNLLDTIRPIGDSSPALSGTIVGMNRSSDDDSADRVQISTDDRVAVNKLKSGDTVKLSNTTNYNGLYHVIATDNGSFVIDAPFRYGEIGDWEKVENEENGLVFDGLLTGYEKSADGKLKVHAVNHGLATGDLVQIIGDGDYAGEYPLLKHDQSSFTIERRWSAGEAVNIKLESRKRRGLVFDGKRDWIATPFSAPINLSAGFTIEAWVKLNSAEDQTLLTLQPASKAAGTATDVAATATVVLQNGKLSIAITRPQLGRSGALRLESATPAILREWLHIACSYDGKQLHLLENGEVKASVSLEELNKKAKIAQDALAKQLTKDIAALRAAYTAAPKHPANYWCRLALSADTTAVTAGPDTSISREPANNRDEQLWRIEHLDNGVYTIRNKATNRVLESMGLNRSIQQTEWRDAESQTWLLEAVKNDFFTIHSKTDGKVVDGYLGGFLVGNAWPAEMSNAQSQQWLLTPVGPAIVTEAQAALDLLTTYAKPTFQLAAGALSLAATPQLRAGLIQPTNLLQGQIADVRLWATGRSDKQINNAMYLQLTGRETGLVGYWRLGGIAIDDDGSQHAFDFSVHANHGAIQGAPYAGGVTLSRMLRDAKTEAITYSNTDLFAVREGAIYIESFEFRTDTPIDPKNADGKNGALFAPSLWGRLSRTSEEKQTFDPIQKAFQFEALTDNWWRATCRFMVPEGVRLLRCFEIGAVAGTWATLELRRYRLMLVSDTVTISRSAECAKLTSLITATPSASAEQKAALKARRTVLEVQKAPLEARKQELTAQAEAALVADGLQAKRIQYLAKQKELEVLETEAKPYREDYEYRVNNPFDYACEIIAKNIGYVLGVSRDYNTASSMMATVQAGIDSHWRIDYWNANHDPKTQKYRIHDYPYDLDVSIGSDQVGAISQSYYSESDYAWRFEQIANTDTYRILHIPTSRYMSSRSRYAVHLASFNETDDSLIWQIKQFGELEGLKTARQQWMERRGRLDAFQTDLAPLATLIKAADVAYANYISQIQEVDQQILALAKELATINTQLVAMFSPTELLDELKVQEKLEAPVVTRQKELEQLLASLGDPNQLHARKKSQQELVDRITADKEIKRAAYVQDGRNIAYYWCIIFNSIGRENFALDAAGADKGQLAILMPLNDGDDSQLWRFIPTDGDHYIIKTKLNERVLDGNDSSNGKGIVLYDRHGGHNQQWHLRRGGQNNTDTILQIRSNGRALDYGDSAQGRGVVITDYNEQATSQQWMVDIIGESFEPRIREICLAYHRVLEELKIAQAELDRINNLINSGATQQKQWQAEFASNTIQLNLIQQHIAELQAAYFTLLAKLPQAAQAMPTMPDLADPRGLTIQGALLSAIRPATRLHALESCTGLVTLSYQDFDGNLRQTKYDSAYDADGKGEEWLTETYRVAVALDGRSAPMPLASSIFSDMSKQITIEFWAKGGYNLPNSNALLGGVDQNNNRRLSIQLPNEKGEVIWEAGLATSTTSIDRLTRVADVALYRGSWNHWAFVKDGLVGEMRIYLNGKLWHKNDTHAKQGNSLLLQDVAGISKAAIGGIPGQAANWHGQISELRIWNVALGEREIETNSMLTLSGQEPGLLAYYPFNEAQGEQARDATGRPQQAVQLRGSTWVPCTAPIGRLLDKDHMPIIAPMLLSTEYSRVKVDAQRRKSVMMLRCLAMPSADGIHLLDEQRIEELEMKWIGNAQINPTLIGYIEGAPPIPSENLTEEQDYNGATSVELVQSSDVEYSWTREQETSSGMEVGLLAGMKSESSAGALFMTSVEEVKTGIGANVDFANSTQHASTVGASQSLMSSDRLELRGSQEPDIHFPYLGRRFIPKNIGYALVTSGLADVFVSKLKRSGRMIGYQILPVEGVPLDVNTITFMINPAYTMAGSLDGMTGSAATSDRFFKHVPEMRSQYGSLYPASYFRLKEAYALKSQIDEQDKAHQSYFNQFSISAAAAQSFNTKMESAASPEIQEIDEKIEQKQDELYKLRTANPVNQALVDQKQKEIDVLEQQRKEQEQSERKSENEQRQDQINSTHSDLSSRANASDSFDKWQRKMESLQVRAGKRNIVNTYVWDGDGGFHAEEQQFASTVEHTVGGAFDLNMAIGGQASLAIAKVLVEVSAYANFSMTQTLSKTERGSKGMELHVDLSGVESRGITDYRDYPILPGEKVDRYRFMSFFLENTTNHWHDFFNYVVDPQWLNSNDEEARALRQTQNAQPNKVWRVMHRITYVERPALMGFGRSIVKSDEAADDIRALRDQLTELQGKVGSLQRELNEKLDLLLSRKP